MATQAQQPFESIRVVGGLVGSKILQDARQYNLPGQGKADYGVEPSLSFNDELGRYWVIARSRWKEFQQSRQREDLDLHTVTVDDWLLPLLSRVLGYEINRCSQKQQIGEREFPITHQSFSGAVPMVLSGADQDLDKSDVLFGQEGRRRSPVGLAQEFLNANGSSLWAVVSNGLVLRLLRDNPAMTRPAYVEVDFTRLFEEDNYADFATLWLLLHASRLQPQNELPERCWLEQWREKGHDEGERALDKLRYGVADALRQLGTGFLAHPANIELRQQLSEESLTTDAYFQQVLRLVYRFLFLLTAEDREIALLPREHEGQDYRTARSLYEAGYSLSVLRNKARQRRHYDHHSDAWQMLAVTFDGFAKGQPQLAQPALGGLFAEDQCWDLASSQIENRYLYSALFDLCYFEHQGILARINYRDMDTEEFGSVYESLLELIPQIHTEGQWRFSFIGDAKDETAASGHSRKLTGSYYTPDSLVQELIKSALDPVIRDRLATNPQNPRKALLSITVCDPACGSGHFLLAAARRLATELAQIDAGSDQPTEAHYRHALRDVVRHCIYGVDLNPMAVELCKTGLWLESIEPGKPLSFLDSHVQCGNALVGVLSPEQLENGIPTDAYKPLSGDDKKVCGELKKQNAQASKKLAISLRLIPQTFNEVEAMPEDTVAQIEAKRRAYAEARNSQNYQSDRLKEDLFTAAFFAPKTADTTEQVPTNAHLRLAAEGQTLPEPVLALVREIVTTHRFLHWPLAFPQIFGEGAPGGFDVMLGNPPWERIKLQEQEFFASRAPEIAAAKNAAIRGRMIQALAENPNASLRRLYSRFLTAKQGAEGSSAFARLSGRFPLTGRGDVNLYALFAEHFAKAINAEGRSGVIVPTGIATDDSTKYFFGWLADGQRLASLYDFENREAIFSGVHRSYKFCLLTMGKALDAADLSFFLTQTSQLSDPRRHFTLSAAEFTLINPSTKTCPVFRAQKDAEITKKLYRGHMGDHVESLLRDIKRYFDMNKPSVLSACTDNPSAGDLPILEAKLIHQFDTRWATYSDVGEGSRRCEVKEKSNPSFEITPRYWTSEDEIMVRVSNAPKPVIDSFKNRDTDALSNAINDWLAEQGVSIEDENLLPSKTLRDQEYDLFSSQLTPKPAPIETSVCRNAVEMIKDNKKDLLSIGRYIISNHTPQYMLGWRDICRATDERTVIATVFPLSGSDFTLRVLNTEDDPRKLLLLTGNLNSLVYDFLVRQKLSGTHLSDYIIRQVPLLNIDKMTSKDFDFLMPKLLELLYVTHDLRQFAKALGHSGDPFPFDPVRRRQLRCELDAYYAKLYGLSRDELRYILDPADVMGDEYPSETFRVLKNKELREFGEYRTQRLVLEAWDNLYKEYSPAEDHHDITASATPYDDLSALPDNALAKPGSVAGQEGTLALISILRSLEMDTSAKEILLTWILVLHPKYLHFALDKQQSSEWLRLVGDEAQETPANVADFVPKSSLAWGAAKRLMRSGRHIIEKNEGELWSASESLSTFPATPWLDARAKFVLSVIGDQAFNSIIDAAPTAIREFLNAQAA